jgi:hypothetical protein
MERWRSARQERAHLIAVMRAGGKTWVDIAEDFRDRYGVSARKAFRWAHGWSQADVARHWCARWPDEPKTEQNISLWETWPESGHEPSLRVLGRLAALYACNLSDLVADLSLHRGLDGADDTGDAAVALNRRAVVAALGGALASTVLPTPVMIGPRDLSSGLPDYFRSQLEGHYRADMLLGPHLLIETVVPQYETIRQVADMARGDIHRDLLEVATAFAALIGWLHQDAGDLPSSFRWRSETLDMAHRSGNPQLLSYALTNKAMLGVDTGDGVQVVDLAAAALSDRKKLCPKAVVLATQQAAHSHSLSGDADACKRALDESADLVGDTTDDGHVWGNAVRRTPAYIDIHRATCLTRMNLTGEALDLWPQVMARQPTTAPRDSGVYLARYARALLAAGEPGEAAIQAAQAVEHYQATGSARMRRELVRLLENTRSWQRTAAGRHLYDTLQPVNPSAP